MLSEAQGLSGSCAFLFFAAGDNNNPLLHAKEMMQKNHLLTFGLFCKSKRCR